MTRLCEVPELESILPRSGQSVKVAEVHPPNIPHPMFPSQMQATDKKQRVARARGEGVESVDREVPYRAPSTKLPLNVARTTENKPV